MRLFIALTLPQAVRDDLDRLATALPGLRWAPSDNYHLTLRFLGEVERPDAQDIDEASAEGLACRLSINATINPMHNIKCA